MVIQFMYFFSKNNYNELMKPISDILPKPHKVPKDMSPLGLKYEKIGVCLDNDMLFWKEHTNEKKCLECGQSR
jgi:hypothetical protein